MCVCVYVMVVILEFFYHGGIKAKVITWQICFWKSCQLKIICNKSPVLVCLGCCNKRPSMGWLINNRNLFLMVLESGKPKVKALADLVCDDSLFPGSYSCHLSVTSQGRGTRELSGAFFIRTLIPFMRALPS